MEMKLDVLNTTTYNFNNIFQKKDFITYYIKY